MMGTFDCIYETPCHWCSKWDKMCDKNAGYESPTPLILKADLEKTKEIHNMAVEKGWKKEGIKMMKCNYDFKGGR